jgi:hypothetical protein
MNSTVSQGPFQTAGSSYPKDQLESLFATDSSDDCAQALHATLLMETNLRIPDASILMSEIISREGRFGRFVVCNRLGTSFGNVQCLIDGGECYTESNFLCAKAMKFRSFRGETLETPVDVYLVYRLEGLFYKCFNVFCCDHHTNYRQV